MKSFSALADRERLVHPLLFALLCAINITGMVLIFPGRRLAHSLANPSQQDSASVAYVDQALEAWPDDAELRLRVAERWIEAGEFPRVRVAIEPLLEDEGPAGGRARFLSLAVERQALLAIPPADRPREAVELLMSNLEELAAVSRDVTHLEWLARTALLFGEPLRAARLFERLATRDLAQRNRWLRLAAEWSVAAGDPVRAAGIHATIAYETLNEEEFCDAALESVQALRSANREGPGLERLLEFLDWYPANLRLLEQGVMVARSQNRPTLARDLGRRIVEQRAVPRESLERQIEAELAQQDVAAALRIGLRVVSEYPSEAQPRARVAQLMTWSGRTADALPYWVAAVRDSETTEYIEDALAAARSLNDAEAVIEIYRAKNARSVLSAENVLELAAAYEAMGDPAGAERELRAYLRETPDALEPALVLARLQHGQGDLEGSLATQRRILRQHELTTSRVLAAARTLSALGDDRAALELLQSNRSLAGQGDTEFWKALARLAWEAERDTEALEALRSLWRSGPRTEQDAQRLIALLRAAGYDEETMGVAEEAWREFSEDEYVIHALEAAVLAQRFEVVGRLSIEIEATRPQLLGDKRYWVAVAGWRAAENDIGGAAAAYERALEIEPSDSNLLAGALWFLIDRNELERIRYFVDRHDPGERPQRDAWGAYNAALRRIDRPGESLRRYDHFARTHPDDVLWGLEYAAALLEAGREDTSWRVRRHLLEPARRAARQLLAYSSWTQEEARVVVGATRLVREHLGDRAAESWLSDIERRAEHEDNAFLREFVVEQYLSQDRDDRARAIVQLGERGEPHTERAVPRWERLSLALRNGDLPEVDANLEGRGLTSSEVGRIDEIEGLRRLGRDDEAWSLSLSRLWEKSNEVDIDNRTLLGFASGLALRHPQAARSRYSHETLGNLEWTSSLLEATVGTNTWQADLTVVESTIESRSDNVDVADRGSQTRLAAEVTLATDRAHHRFGFGANDDRVDAMPFGSYDLETRLGGNVTGRVGVSVNRVGEASDALRLAGATDQVMAAVAIELTPREYASARIAWNEYYDRTRSQVSRGLGLDFELGHRLHAGTRQLAVRAFGSAGFHRHAGRLPDAFFDVLGTGATPESVVPREFAIVGVGLSTRHGDPGDWGPATGGVRYHADLSAGWLLPVGQLSFAARLGAGVGVFGRDELSLFVHYGDSQGGLENQDSSGVSVQYTYRFGR